MNAPPVQYVTTSDGYSIAYAVSGAGRPFVILPSGFEHVQLAWQYPSVQPWLEGLAARYQLIQIDERGTGMSMRGLKEDHAYEDYLQDIEAVVNHLNPTPFVIYAASTRVTTAVQFAVDHPERVFALILGPSGVSQADRQNSFFHALPVDNWDMFLRSLASSYQRPDDVSRSVALLNQAFDHPDFLLRMRSRAQGISSEVFARLRTPTLVLHPRDYPLLPATEAMKIAQLARGTMTLIDGAFLLGNAEQGIRAIEAFLAEIESSSAITESPPHDDGLSLREIEVLRLIAAGRSNREIAEQLVLSIRTVERHIANLYAKTGIHTKAQATDYAHRQSLT